MRKAGDGDSKAVREAQRYKDTEEGLTTKFHEEARRIEPQRGTESTEVG